MAFERGRRLSQESKLNILEMERRNVSVGAMHNELLSKGISITKQGIRSFLKHQSITRRPRTITGSHSHKIRPIHKKLVNMWIARNTEITARTIQLKLKDVFGVKVGQSAACNLRKELGWKRSQGKYCQQISHKNKVVRKEWCYRVWKEKEQFQDVIFTDESCIEMNAKGRLFFHNKKQSGDFQRQTIKRSKSKHAYKVNVWGGISYKGRTPICIFTGIMDSIIYQGILQENLIPFVQEKLPDGFRLSQMETLSTLKKGTGTRVQPYQKPLRLKVVAVKSSREYKPGSKMLAMALADKTDFIRGVCFEEAKFKYLTEGAGVLLSNFSIKNGEISIGSSTKVYSTSPPDVDADISKDAIEMIHPTEPEVVPIQTAKKSPKGKTTSVKGKILSDGAVTTAAIRGNNVNVKTIEVSDGRDKVKVSLWRDLSLSPTKPGANVKITHLYASNNTYYNDVVLSTTSNSTVAVSIATCIFCATYEA
ncbi:hypothetical protein FSP39_018716 [Pinctada imbricata]|uniref:Uncharacterized protein n=1 Tax=Pinctada imbricata TaxID=66713 RepID=A0AA88YKX8_PINIB|nr:hypothetical protein FSP39_018716 [Pinctada imbricata]